MAARKRTHEVSALASGDWEAPNVLYGVHEVPVELPAGTLGVAKPLTAAAIHERAAVGYLPSWMDGFAAHALTSIAGTLRKMGRPNRTPKGPYTFDAFHRLDELTFVGEPSGSKIPILAVTPGEAIFEDASGDAFAKMLARAAKSGGDPAKYFEVSLHDPKSVAQMTRHTSALVLEESWRLVSFFRGVGVGRAVGSVALLPKEERDLTISRTVESTLTRVARSTVIERLTDKSKKSFSTKFNRVQSRDKKRGSSASWSSATSSSVGDSTSERKRGGQSSMSVSDFSSATRETVESMVNERTEDTTITIHNESTSVEKTTDRQTDVFRIRNMTDQAVTHVYHQLVHGYRTLLELVNVAAVLHDPSISSHPIPLALDGALGKQLEELPGIGPAKAKTISAAVAASLKERYGALGFVAQGAGPKVERAGPSDAAMSIYSRAALLGDRRSTGRLPLTIQTIDSALQTSDLHVVPYVPENKMPPPSADASLDTGAAGA